MWDYVPFNLFFVGHVTEQHALDRELTEDRLFFLNPMDLGPSNHQLHMCSNRDLSDGGRLRCDHAFDDLPYDTWLREGAPIKIGRAK